ncbi:PA14 domain-containing protein [Clostridium sp. D53t1_180928_C8]|uniref:PA14 domain-containing protein n=1 Tax=Clostridium sp. D53t1_180928_C8 TaxID=2787101 RepID=UPI0018AAF2F9|nr:PA14 domain-containing protein [Clostridium sp. D53t1_180928_C8]
MIKRKGSSLILVMVLAAALLITGTAVMLSVKNTMKFNVKYNEINNLELAAESGVNIGKNYLINKINERNTNEKIISVNQIDYKISSDYIYTIITEDQGIDYNLTIEKSAESTDNKGIYIIKCDVEKSGVKKSKNKSVVVNLNNGKIDSEENETEEPTKPSYPDDLVQTPGYLTQQSYDVSHMNSLSSATNADWSNRTDVFRNSYGIVKYIPATISDTYNKYAGNFSSDKTTATIFTQHLEYVKSYKESKKVWGYIKVDSDGEYKFRTQSDDGIMLVLTVDGIRKTLINNFKPKGYNPPDYAKENVYLKKDVYYPIYMEYFNWGGNARYLLQYTRVNSGVYNNVPANWCYPSNNPIPPTETEDNSTNGDLNGALNKEVSLIIPNTSKIISLNHVNNGIILVDKKEKYDNYNELSGVHNNKVSIKQNISLNIPKLNVKNIRTGTFYLSNSGITNSINNREYYKMTVSNGEYEINNNYKGFIIVKVNGDLEIYGNGNAQNINIPIIFVVNGNVLLNGNQANNIQSMVIMANKVENNSKYTIGFNSALIITKELKLPKGHINKLNTCTIAIDIIDKIIKNKELL